MVSTLTIPRAKTQRSFQNWTRSTKTFAGYARGGNGRGRGGMETKLEAVRIANEDGRPAIIANGRTPGILDSILAGKPVGTLFFPRKSR